MFVIHYNGSSFYHFVMENLVSKSSESGLKLFPMADNSYFFEKIAFFIFIEVLFLLSVCYLARKIL